MDDARETVVEAEVEGRKSDDGRRFSVSDAGGVEAVGGAAVSWSSRRWTARYFCGRQRQG